MTVEKVPLAVVGGAPDDDRTLVGRSVSGDDGAFRILVERYQGEVFNLALRSLGRREVAEEVTQDTFVRLHRSLSRLRFESTLGTWLFRVAINLCRDHWRREGRHSSTVSFEEEGEANGIASAEPSPDRRLELVEASERVDSLLLEVSPAQREVLVLSYVNGLTHDEISKTLGCSRGTVASRIHRGLKVLGRHLTATESVQ